MDSLIKKTLVAIAFVISLMPLTLSGQEYSDVDSHVASIVQGQQDVLQLTRELVKPFQSPEKQIRAIFSWITNNIAYDYQALLRGQVRLATAEDVLQTRKAICGGYARLLKKMARTAGFEAELVGGFSKGYGYDTSNPFADRNRHAWNAVKVDGTWRLLDATWGAGYISDGKFKRSFNDYYFFTPPEELIQTHYPEQRRWQLLDEHRNRTNFMAMPLTKPAFFRYDMRMISHTDRKIQASDSLSLKLSGSKDVVLLSRLYVGENELDDMLSFAQRSDDGFEVRAIFPQPSNYILRIFAKRKTDTGNYQWLLDYEVEASKGVRQAAGFPEKLGSFDDFNARIYEPMSRFLTAGDSVDFKLTVEDARELALIHEDSFQFLQKDGEVFSGRFEVPPADFFIGARFPNSDYFMYLLRYEGW
ncbi:MAG: transglutaminase domain-containing protein [Calditrichia bacterium]